MKTTTLLATGTALAGFALGWALKPAAPAAGSTTSAPVPPRAGKGELIAPGQHPAAKLAIREAPAEGEVEGDPDAVALQRRLESNFHSLKNRRDRAKLLRLSEALGLTEEQEKAIAGLLEKRTGGFNPYGGDLTKPGDALAEAAHAEGDFEQSLRALLDPDQLARLDAYKARESDNRIEAAAQAELARVTTNVDLSADQRQAALEVFRESSRTDVADDPAGWHLLEDSSSMASGNRQAMRRLRDLFSDPSVANDPKKLQEALNDAQKEAAQQKVELLEEILTPAQLIELQTSLDAGTLFIDSLMSNTSRDPRFR